ncbi:hypothetical protein U1Q18_040364 [Sarracenia purpurea var. burkii]
MEVAGSVPFVKASPDGDLVGTASAHQVASVSKAKGEDSKAVSDVELEVMNGSESSEEGPEPFGTELADEVTCSVYGSNDHEYLYENVNCHELDVLDVNSDCLVKVKLAELFVEENKEKQTEPCLTTDGFVGKISGPADQIPQVAGSISMDKSRQIDKGVKPSWADIVEDWLTSPSVTKAKQSEVLPGVASGPVNRAKAVDSGDPDEGALEVESGIFSEPSLFFG